MKNVKYIKVLLDYLEPDFELIGSLAALPGVVLCERMYPDDPALQNILLLAVDSRAVDVTLESISTCENVQYSEVIDKPTPR